jgi:DnaJ-class molecular chaperone
MAALIGEVFGKNANLYEILELAKTATEAQIKKAYYKKALLWVGIS